MNKLNKLTKKNEYPYIVLGAKRIIERMYGEITDDIKWELVSENRNKETITIKFHKL